MLQVLLTLNVCHRHLACHHEPLALFDSDQVLHESCQLVVVLA